MFSDKLGMMIDALWCDVINDYSTNNIAIDYIC